MSELKIIVAVGKEGEIGKRGELIWRIPADLKRFKALTMDHPIVMGRKTWESLPKKPLPGRRNIVLTRQPGYEAPGAETAASIEEVVELTEGEAPFIIGGAEIYREFLPLVSELYLTEVDASCPEADAFMPENYKAGFEMTEESPREITPEGIGYRYVTYRRKS